MYENIQGYECCDSSYIKLNPDDVCCDGQFHWHLNNYQCCASRFVYSHIVHQGLHSHLPYFWVCTLRCCKVCTLRCCTSKFIYLGAMHHQSLYNFVRHIQICLHKFGCSTSRFCILRCCTFWFVMLIFLYLNSVY